MLPTTMYMQGTHRRRAVVVNIVYTAETEAKFLLLTSWTLPGYPRLGFWNVMSIRIRNGCSHMP